MTISDSAETPSLKKNPAIAGRPPMLQMQLPKIALHFYNEFLLISGGQGHLCIANIHTSAFENLVFMSSKYSPVGSPNACSQLEIKRGVSVQRLSRSQHMILEQPLPSHTHALISGPAKLVELLTMMRKVQGSERLERKMVCCAREAWESKSLAPTPSYA